MTYSRTRNAMLLLLAVLFASANACGEASGVGASPEGRERNSAQVAFTVDDGEQERSSAAERLNNTPLLELSLSSARAEAKYDPEAIISLTLELFSPRAFAVETFERYGGEDDGEIEKPSLTLRDMGDAFPARVKLYEVSDGTQRSVPVVFSAGSVEDDIQLGRGDVAEAEVFIEPGAFQTAGEVVLLARLELEKYGTVESQPLKLALAPGTAGPLEIAVERLRFLRATGKLEEARALGLEIVENYPEAIQAHLLLAQIYEESGAFEPALDSYRKALALVPETQEEPPVLIVGKIRTLMEALRNR